MRKSLAASANPASTPAPAKARSVKNEPASAHMAAVVLFDIKGYSHLSQSGQRRFFEEVLPRISELLLGSDSSPTTSRPLDANTWGDAVLCVFESVITAARFCTELRRLFRSEIWRMQEFDELRPRIALHYTHLHRGVDPIREIRGDHYYGPGLVKTARLEPIVDPGHVWVTEEAAKMLSDAIANGELRGLAVPSLGVRDLAKGAGPLSVFCLLEEHEPHPKLAESPLAEQAPPSSWRHGGSHADDALSTSRQLARMSSALAANQYVENFHIYAGRCTSPATLARTFSKYHLELLLTLRLPSRPERGNGNVCFDADVLLVDSDTGRFKPSEQPTAQAHRRFLPEMHLAKAKRGRFVEPSPGDGLAPYVLWANSSGRRGVGAAEDVNASRDIVYHEDTSSADAQGLGAYHQTVVHGMYKQPQVKQGHIPYGSILCAPLGIVSKPPADVSGDAHIEWIGVLNITASHALRFTNQDCAWAELMSALVGSLHQSFRSRLAAIEAGDYRSNRNAKRRGKVKVREKRKGGRR
jgi:hypothetical protein